MLTLNGYPIIYMPEHKHTNKDGYVYEHIIVAEQKLGRALRENEVVHHIDGSRNNNSIDNLLIFKTKSDHTAFHKYFIYELDEEGIAYCPIRKKCLCKICGKPIDKHATYCKDCYINQIYFNKPSRDKLKELIKSKSFLAISKEFGVSDNAIREWCRHYNLPYKKSEIEKISLEDWEKI